MDLAPVVLFVYRRSQHTRQTVEALQNNTLAGGSELIIYADGAKSDSDRDDVAAVRNYIKTIKGFKRVSIIEREHNWGLAQSIIAGVTETINKFGCCIVLEDDLVCSPYFLQYMNESLMRYRDNQQIMHVAGYMFPIDPSGLKETFFYRNTSCWGWGTWKRAWDLLETDVDALMRRFSDEQKFHFNIDGAYGSWRIMEQQRNGEIDSWSIRWYASVFLAGGMCLHPSRSLIRNIGHDASGVHCAVSDVYDVTVSTEPIHEYEDNVAENKIALERIRAFLKSIHKRSFRRTLSRLFKLCLGRF